MMAWQPQEEGLKHLSFALRDSLSAYDRARQKQAEEVCPSAHAVRLHKRRNTNFAVCIAYCPGIIFSGLCELLDIHFRIRRIKSDRSEWDLAVQRPLLCRNQPQKLHQILLQADFRTNSIVHQILDTCYSTRHKPTVTQFCRHRHNRSCAAGRTFAVARSAFRVVELGQQS